ncbi:phosphotransferase [Actinoplanes sp. NPDC026619]|uniref:phosphotransferase n=1 Tax=Actinoplanes sp. NPDC026619 TaxID=3155798 RepID=UPI00340C0C70
MDVAEIVAREFGLGAVVSFRRATAGIMNVNWQLVTGSGTYAVKLQRDGTPEQARMVQRVLPSVAELRVRVPIARVTRGGDTLLRVGDDWYMVFDWLPGTHPREGDVDLDACAAFGDLVGRLHLRLAGVCPVVPRTVVDTPVRAADAAAALAGYAERGTGDDFDLVARPVIAWRRALLAEVGDHRPAGGAIGPAGWTHGDLQPFNLLGEDGRITGVLDWDRLGVRTYGLEVVRAATITFSTGEQDGLDLERVAAFARAYRVHIEVSDAELADAAHRRWWVLATDVWPLDRHYDDGDTSCDDIFVRRCRFLRWWSSHRAAVVEALTRR